jgi:type I restriction enzyme S subunit
MSPNFKTLAAEGSTNPMLVPKLRFPEFRGAEGWDADGLGKVADFVNEKVPVEGVALESYVSTENMLPDYSGIARASKLPTTGSATRYRPNDNLVSNIRPYLRKVWVADKEGGASNDVIVIRAKQRLLPQYLSCLLKNDAFIDYVMTGAKGVKMPRGDIGSMKEYPTLYPSLAEQQKIAECLSSLDELLAAQARKMDALKTHKKGLMQQLFPREGETQPRLRFPEFQNAREWVQKTVGDVSEVLMCKRIFAEETNPNEGTPFYKIGTLGGTPDAFISREKFEDYRSRYNYPRTGEVLITCSGTVGKCLPFDGKDSYFQDSNIVWLDNPTGEVSNEFLFILLTNVNWGGLNSTTITRIYGPDLRGMTINYPEDKAEQQRIAACLSSLDALITAETQKHDALKTHKKGLMQQLFPPPEEIAGL